MMCSTAGGVCGCIPQLASYERLLSVQLITVNRTPSRSSSSVFQRVSGSCTLGPTGCFSTACAFVFFTIMI